MTASARAGVAATLGYQAFAARPEPLDAHASAPVRAPSRTSRLDTTPGKPNVRGAGRAKEILLPPAGPHNGPSEEESDDFANPETTGKDGLLSTPPRSTINLQHASHDSLNPDTAKLQLKESLLSPPPRNSANSQRASRNSINSQRASHDSSVADAADPFSWLLRIVGAAINHTNFILLLLDSRNNR
jgi:hypothetical protein